MLLDVVYPCESRRLDPRCSGSKANKVTNYSLGVDLGTTFTAAALVHEGLDARVVMLGNATAAIPSVVYVSPDGQVIAGEAAERRALTEPERVAREFKRRLGDPVPLVVGGSPFAAERFLAAMLSFVLALVTEREGSPPSMLAVTHPANWGDYKLDLLQQVVQLAKFEHVVMLTEPEAAAIHYASNERIDPGSVVAVYDLGGGTFDATVLRKTGDDFEILGTPGGLDRLGGIDFDEAVYHYVTSLIEEDFAKLDAENPMHLSAVVRLRGECVRAKEALSSETAATIPVFLPTVQTEVRITRAEFEAMIGPPVTDSLDMLRAAIEKSGVSFDEIDRILLVGGSSRIPLVGQRIVAELGRPIGLDTHPKHSVSLGAALIADRKGAKRVTQPREVLDDSPHHVEDAPQKSRHTASSGPPVPSSAPKMVTQPDHANPTLPPYEEEEEATVVDDIFKVRQTLAFNTATVTWGPERYTNPNLPVTSAAPTFYPAEVPPAPDRRGPKAPDATFPGFPGQQKSPGPEGLRGFPRPRSPQISSQSPARSFDSSSGYPPEGVGFSPAQEEQEKPWRMPVSTPEQQGFEDSEFVAGETPRKTPFRKKPWLYVAGAILLVLIFGQILSNKDDCSGMNCALDAATQEVFPLVEGAFPVRVVFAHGSLWVSEFGNDTVRRLDPETMGLLQAIKVGSGPVGLAVADDGVWVANYADNTVQKINKDSNEAGEPVALGVKGPNELVVAGENLWIVVQGEKEKKKGSVVRYQPGTKDLKVFPVGPYQAISIDAKGDDVWVGSSDDYALVNVLGEGSAPWNLQGTNDAGRPDGKGTLRGIAIDSAEDKVWAVNTDNGLLFELFRSQNQTDGDVSKSRNFQFYDIEGKPFDLLLAQDHVWVTSKRNDGQSSELLAIDPRGNEAVIARTALDGCADPRGLDASAHFVVVACADKDEIIRLTFSDVTFPENGQIS